MIDEIQTADQCRLKELDEAATQVAQIKDSLKEEKNAMVESMQALEESQAELEEKRADGQSYELSVILHHPRSRI